MRTFVLGALALLAIPAILTTSARASDAVGQRALLGVEELQASCAEQRDVCQGYIGAVIDVEHLHSALAGRQPLYCIPESEKLPELVDRVTSWLAVHPEQAMRSAVAQVTFALIDAFPCEDQAPASPDPSVQR
jgi:hypothetical protein